MAIPEDYEALKKDYLLLKKDLDHVNQELYDCKRQLKIVEALQHEYQSEIEILQSEQNTDKQKLEQKIAQLEEILSNAKLKRNERIQALEVDVAKQEEEKEILKAEIDLLRKVGAAQNTSEDTTNILDELLALKQERDDLLANEEELKISVEILQKNCITLEETLKENREELLNLRENISCKRDELFKANDLIQKLNDEVFCLKNELETYKNKPLNLDSRGNSLFAEVDDRRVYLQQTINKMKAEYISMKQERAKHLNTISHLRKENKALCDRWKADMEGREDDEDMVLKAYKDRIQTCETLIDQYKRDLAAKPIVISTGTFTEIEFYQKMFNNKLKEIEELRELISTRNLTQLMLSTSLKEANRETRKWRLEATLRQYELELNVKGLPSDNKVAEKLGKLMDNVPPEPKQTMRGPRLACRREEIKNEVSVEKLKTVECENVKSKDVIPINDSADDYGEGSLKQNVTQEGVLNVVEAEGVPGAKVKQEPNADVSDEKENVPKNGSGPGEGSKKVTFTENTVSPKLTDRAALKRNCRRLLVPSAIFIPSE